MRELDPARKVARFEDGGEMSFDLFLGVPKHRAPEVVAESGMCVDGWIPVDPVTLATRWPGVYAVGDVTSVGTPKAGVFAEGQAAVVAGEIIARSGRGAAAGYDGHGVCYLEFGSQGVAVVDVTFVAGQAPFGFLDGPSSDSPSRRLASAPHGSRAGSAPKTTRITCYTTTVTTPGSPHPRGSPSTSFRTPDDRPRPPRWRRSDSRSRRI